MVVETKIKTIEDQKIKTDEAALAVIKTNLHDIATIGDQGVAIVTTDTITAATVVVATIRRIGNVGMTINHQVVVVINMTNPDRRERDPQTVTRIPIKIHRDRARNNKVGHRRHLHRKKIHLIPIKKTRQLIKNVKKNSNKNDTDEIGSVKNEMDCEHHK